MAQATLPPIGAEVPQDAASLPPLPPVGGEVVEMPHYTTANEKDAQGNAVVDPNTIGTFASHFGSQINPIPLGQMIPFPKAAGGAGLDAPAQVAQGFANKQSALIQQAKVAFSRGDYVTAGEKALTWALNYPTLGAANALDKSGTALQHGQYAAAGGDVLGLITAVFGPGALAKMKLGTPTVTRNPNAVEAAAVKFGEARGVPVDAATATSNPAVAGAQFLADRSLGGSVIAGKAKQAQAAALERVGGELASQAKPTAVTPEQAGATIVDTLTQKIAGHQTAADTAYDRLRVLEEHPTNRMTMPGKPTPVDGLPEPMRGQLRRIVHELDAAPYTKRVIVEGQYGGETVRAEGTGGAGAKVFDDIVQRAGSHATRAVVQNQIETYIAGGPETAVVKAALEVAEQRSKGRGGYTVSKPELPPSANEVPTRLEAGRVRGQEMGFPVDLKEVKRALQPVYDQMRRQMPITQQQASPGLKAIDNIINGEDYASLSQADRDLSAIKAIARKQGGLAKLAVTKFDAAVRQAAAYGGPEVMKTLLEGRRATIAKYTTTDVLEALRGEPVQVFRQAVAPQDSGIDLLRNVSTQTPQAVPAIARAYLDDLLGKATAEGGFKRTDLLQAEWRKLGSETKKILFPQPGQTQALDHFFLLAKKIGTNPNPSGSGHIVSLLAQTQAFLYEPVTATLAQVGAAGLSAILHSPRGVRALTRGLSVQLQGVRASAAARAAAMAEVVKAARAAGVGLTAAPAGAADPSTAPAQPTGPSQ